MSPIATSSSLEEHTPEAPHPNAQLSTNGSTNGHPNSEVAPSESIDIPVNDIPAWTPRRKIKVVTVGAGFSALIFAHKLQHQHPEFQEMVEHKIFEARNDIGGTWLVNRYPGVQCDVPAHVYVWSKSDSFSICATNWCRLFHLTPIPTGTVSMPPARKYTNISRPSPKNGTLTEILH